jgi:hypothetical protein
MAGPPEPKGLCEQITGIRGRGRCLIQNSQEPTRQQPSRFPSAGRPADT